MYRRWSDPFEELRRMQEWMHRAFGEFEPIAPGRLLPSGARESGGFILDSGHKFSEKGAFKPSAASKSPPASILFQQPFPAWEIVLAIPDVVGAHDAREVDIFGKECPIPLSEVQELSHIILMDTLLKLAGGSNFYQL